MFATPMVGRAECDRAIAAIRVGGDPRRPISRLHGSTTRRKVVAGSLNGIQRASRLHRPPRRNTLRRLA